MPKLGMKEIRKEQVIAATIQCIVDKGLSKMSVKDISAQAGVSTGIIYHYFKNKEDLLLQVLKESFRKSHEQVMSTVEGLADPMAKLSVHVENIHAVPRENPDFFSVLMNYLGEAKYNPAIQQIVNRFMNNLQLYMKDYLKSDMNTKDLKNLPIIIYALGMGLGIMWTLDNEAYDPDEMGETIQSLVSSYIGGSRFN
jgi:TetR/AcrR family transcriptional repressor of bet genes